MQIILIYSIILIFAATGIIGHSLMRLFFNVSFPQIPKGKWFVLKRPQMFGKAVYSICSLNAAKQKRHYFTFTVLCERRVFIQNLKLQNMFSKVWNGYLIAVKLPFLTNMLIIQFNCFIFILKVMNCIDRISQINVKKQNIYIHI